MSAAVARPTPATEFDSQPLCPHCDYNLTGLPQPRCPECGNEFSWDDVRRRAAHPPAIAFERLRGRQKVLGFLLTWLTVLFAPWKFAAQAVRCISLRNAGLFGAICFAMTPIGHTRRADIAVILSWIATGTVYVILQALLLSLIDWPHRREWKRSAAFWLAIGGYTSAIVPTELVYGPPLIEFDSIVRLFRGQAGGGWISMPSEPWIHWPQVAIWLIGLAFVVAARLREQRIGRVAAILAAVGAALALLCLYAVTIDYVGSPLFNRLDTLIS